MLRGLIERVVVHRTDGGLEVELFEAIVPMVELALGDGKKAALGEEAACSVKVVAGGSIPPLPNTSGLLVPFD